MSASVSLGPNTLHILREAAWKELLRDCQNYSEGPGVRLILLRDEATVQEMLAAIAAATPTPPLPPTA